jgi:hypothetical protein
MRIVGRIFLILTLLVGLLAFNVDARTAKAPRHGRHSTQSEKKIQRAKRHTHKAEKKTQHHHAAKQMGKGHAKKHHA